jgi:hypothetical protein
VIFTVPAILRFLYLSQDSVELLLLDVIELTIPQRFILKLDIRCVSLRHTVFVVVGYVLSVAVQFW